MRRHNLNFDVPVTRAQWEQLGRTAAARGGKQSGLEWKGDRPDEIRVYIRDEDAPSGLQNLVSQGHRYGLHEREVARFVFNDGDPYAALEPPDQPDEPAITAAQEHEVERELEHWVRNRWHDLMRASGIHYVQGHIPTD